MIRTAEPNAPGVTDLQPWQLSPKEVQRLGETITDAPLDKSAGAAPGGWSLLGRLSVIMPKRPRQIEGHSKENSRGEPKP